MSTTTEPLRFTSMAAMKAAFKSSGSHWFDASTMRFFGTRIDRTGRLYGGRVFVASHQPPHGPRVYSVHFAQTGHEQGASLTMGRVGEALLNDDTTNLFKARKLATELGKACERGEVPNYLTYDEEKALNRRFGFDI